MGYLRHRKDSLGFVLVCLLATVLFGSILWAPEAQAVLPPRPTVHGEDRDRKGEAPTPIPVVAQIVLTVSPASGRYWSVVQWQDTQGNWHDVNGWRGDVVNGSIMWWVAEKDFGKGPFRWAVYKEGGPVVHQGGGSFYYPGEKAHLATSQPFNLPGPSQSVTVFLSVAEHYAGCPAGNRVYVGENMWCLKP